MKAPVTLVPGNDHISPTVNGTIESMVFRTSPGGIWTNRSLEGRSLGDYMFHIVSSGVFIGKKHAMERIVRMEKNCNYSCLNPPMQQESTNEN